ncbi:hypothetical protein NDU88_002961 [Pleurodeles waltl]|uniref:Uncharacterized protein n=1 Tax=Pleurodeles waltl TaxID=8319 RepID=A0AAV7MP71_PLEWA|nr:hypothetical protein NDU88_002961 [Pleurodeles waltl]
MDQARGEQADCEGCDSVDNQGCTSAGPQPSAAGRLVWQLTRAAPGGRVGCPKIWRACHRAGLAEGWRRPARVLGPAACWWQAGQRPAAGDNEGPGLRGLEEAVSGARGNCGAAGARAAERGLGLRPIAGGDSGLHRLRRPRGAVGAVGVAWPPRDVVSRRGLADVQSKPHQGSVGPLSSRGDAAQFGVARRDRVQ